MNIPTILVTGVLATGCNALSHTNVPLAGDVEPNPARRTTFDVRDQRGNENVLVMLALSGGGSRAAYFATELMFQLEDAAGVNLLHEVDVISSVSGGSLAAAYYCITSDHEPRMQLQGTLSAPLDGDLAKKLTLDDGQETVIATGPLGAEDIRQLNDLIVPAGEAEAASLNARLEHFRQLSQPAPSGRKWKQRSVQKLMKRNYQARWIGNWFWPWNVCKYWFTAYDRADIMAKTFSDNLFDTRILGRDLKLADLNPERPYLIVNATDATQHTPQRTVGQETRGRELHFGEVFTFTDEDFTDKLGSDIDQYSVGRAVMASACFPSAFAYMTLRDYRQEKPQYVHVFDGGNADNLGLISLSRLIVQLEDGPEELRPDHYVVISVDAFTDPQGVDRDSADPRALWDYIIDTNFLGSVDALLQVNRAHMLNQFATGLLDVGSRYEVRTTKTESGEVVFDYVMATPETRKIENLTFWHIRFRDLQRKSLLRDLNDIPTNLSLSDENAEKIEKAARRLVNHDATELDSVLTALGYAPRP